MNEAYARELGEEARDLARLNGAGLSLAEGYVFRVGADGAAARLEGAIFDLHLRGMAARVRALFPTAGARARYREVVGDDEDCTLGSDQRAYADRALQRLDRAPLRAALGGSLAAVRLRVLGVDPKSGGIAASADPLHGNPDELWVNTTPPPAAPSGEGVRTDRRTGRVLASPDGVNADLAERAADLADRAQLALGRPVELEWATSGGRVVIVAVRSLSLPTSFADAPFRRVALTAADEGTVAPLAVDALDRGLSRGEGEWAPGRTVNRVYARPYRRWVGEERRLRNVSVLTVPLATGAVARATADAARTLRSVPTFSRRTEKQLRAFAVESLDALGDDALLTAFDKRHALVADAFALLDDLRERTREALVAMESTAGPLPRECYPALAAPRPTRSRRRVIGQLHRLATRVQDGGHIGARTALSVPDRRRWDELRRSLVDTRPLGIDVQPDVYGRSERSFEEAVRAALHRTPAALEKARIEAVARVGRAARERGRARAALVVGLGGVVERLANAKGEVAELLSSALLSLRAVAELAGTRLVDAGILEEPLDALYLTLGEIREALGGEPGAYAARVRFRREDDARWAQFDAPRRLGVAQ